MPDVAAQPQSNMLATFSVEEALSKGWGVVKTQWSSLLVMLIVYVLAGAIPAGIVGAAFGGEGIQGLVGSLLSQLWNAFLMIGFMRYMLAQVRGQQPELGMLFSGADRYVQMILVYFVFGIMVVVGAAFFIIPGIYLATKFAFSLMLIADGKSSGMDAFSMSSKMTEGRQLAVFLYFVAGAAMVLIGGILFIIPGIIAGMVMSVGTFLLYEYALAHPSAAMNQGVIPQAPTPSSSVAPPQPSVPEQPQQM